MVLRHATASVLGCGGGGGVRRGRRVKQYVASLSQEPRRLDAAYKFILPCHIVTVPHNFSHKTNTCQYISQYQEIERRLQVSDIDSGVCVIKHIKI
jgi:hypothetical protein